MNTVEKVFCLLMLVPVAIFALTFTVALAKFQEHDKEKTTRGGAPRLGPTETKKVR